MDLKHFIFNILYNKTCFFCLKTSPEMVSVMEDFEIKCEYFVARINLADITKILFPIYDVFQTHSCNNCSNLLIKMFIIFKKRRKFESIILNTIGNIYEKINQFLDLKSGMKVTESSHFNSKPTANTLFLNVNENTEIETRIIQKVEPKIFSEVNVQTLKHGLVNPNISKKNMCVKRQRKNKYYECNQCSYKTLAKATLEGHINKKHLKIRPFKCYICSKGFYRKSNLVEHIQSHSNNKELCELCGDVFRQKKSLMEHLRLHANERPYECNLCGKKFITSGRRSDHVKRSHMVKNECCMLCNKQFGLKKELIRHMRSVHTKL